MLVLWKAYIYLTKNMSEASIWNENKVQLGPVDKNLKKDCKNRSSIQLNCP